MSESPGEAAADATGNLLQLVAAILLGLAATLTALSAYESALKEGVALQGYTSSTRTLSDSNSYYDEGVQISSLDQQLFVAYEEAYYSGNEELASELYDLMRPELAKAIDWWEDESDVATPMDDVEGNPYYVSEYDEADKLATKADREFNAAAKDAASGDQFELSTVLFALTLFFGGISTVFRRRSVSRALLGIGGLTLVIGAIQFTLASLA